MQNKVILNNTQGFVCAGKGSRRSRYARQAHATHNVYAALVYQISDENIIVKLCQSEQPLSGLSGLFSQKKQKLASFEVGREGQFPSETITINLKRSDYSSAQPSANELQLRPLVAYIGSLLSPGKNSRFYNPWVVFEKISIVAEACEALLKYSGKPGHDAAGERELKSALKRCYESACAWLDRSVLDMSLSIPAGELGTVLIGLRLYYDPEFQAAYREWQNKNQGAASKFGVN